MQKRALDHRFVMSRSLWVLVAALGVVAAAGCGFQHSTSVLAPTATRRLIDQFVPLMTSPGFRTQRDSVRPVGTLGRHQASCATGGIVYSGDLITRSGGP